MPLVCGPCSGCRRHHHREPEEVVYKECRRYVCVLSGRCRRHQHLERRMRLNTRAVGRPSTTPFRMFCGSEFKVLPGFVKICLTTRLISSSHSRKDGILGEPFCSDTRRHGEFTNVATEIGRTASGMRMEVRNQVPVMASAAGLKPLRGIIHQGQRSTRQS